MDLSIVISLYNEEESLRELIEWIRKAISESYLKDKEYEIIMINDGSTDGSWKEIETLAKEDEHIRAISFRRNYGKSAALFEGFKAAQGDVVVTMDADLQDDPEEIPELYNTFTKNIPSKLYNYTARKVTGIKLHDMNCGLKAYKNEVVKAVEVYGDMHRYIPYLAKNAGYGKIGEKVVHHQKRKFGKSKFGIDRFFNGVLDLMTIYFLSKFGKKPMHIFGLLGIISFLTGGFITVWIIADKLISQAHGLKFRPVTDQPLFYLALVAVVIGTLLFMAGFLGELISRNSQNRNEYNINKTIR